MIKHVITAFGIIIGLVILGVYGFRFYTKSFSPEGSVRFISEHGVEISVNYSRPYKKGRELFGPGALIPYGEVWRTGANEATEISISKDIYVFGRPLKSGTYTLFSIPGEISWTIIFNCELDQWGAFNYDPVKDALRVNVPSLIIPRDVEMFTIDFVEGSENIEMRLLWGQTMVTIPITLA